MWLRRCPRISIAHYPRAFPHYLHRLPYFVTVKDLGPFSTIFLFQAEPSCLSKLVALRAFGNPGEAMALLFSSTRSSDYEIGTSRTVHLLQMPSLDIEVTCCIMLLHSDVLSLLALTKFYRSTRKLLATV